MNMQDKPACRLRVSDMTNYDKHKDEILKLAKERYSDFYAAEALAAHDISGLADADNVIKWLFDEYECTLNQDYGEQCTPLVMDDDFCSNGK